MAKLLSDLKNKGDWIVPKRLLTREERGICERSIKSLQNEQKDKEFQVKYGELMLQLGLDVNYEKQKQQFKSKLKLHIEELDENKKAISDLQDQLKNGVEVKE